MSRLAPRWIVITDSITSYKVSRYSTEAAAREYYRALDVYIGGPAVLTRMLCRVEEYEDSMVEKVGESPNV